MHNTIGSTIHSLPEQFGAPLYAQQCTMTNIRPDRDLNFVPPDYKPQLIRMRHPGRPLSLEAPDTYPGWCGYQSVQKITSDFLEMHSVLGTLYMVPAIPSLQKIHQTGPASLVCLLCGRLHGYVEKNRSPVSNLVRCCSEQYMDKYKPYKSTIATATVA